ncbi:unnamed protein product [Spirodela intermedia]|uniref:Uncharacterized protein n=2 Tax=Spirodela intermedia TaxID=51605 RepID=A0A7I8KPL3_SPIIN|nr:unnamed protein product [Spirodela intermedia]
MQINFCCGSEFRYIYIYIDNLALYYWFTYE